MSASWWHRLLAWGFRKRRDAWVRIEIELVGALDGPIDRIVEHRDQIIVFTRYSVYTISHDWRYGGTSVRRVA